MDTIKAPFLLAAGGISATFWGGFQEVLSKAALPANEHELGAAFASLLLLLAPVAVQWCFKHLLTYCKARWGEPEVEAAELLETLVAQQVARYQAGHLPPTANNVQSSVPSLDAP